ncbi:MAG: phytanoyl-CoA dioxygenase [Acidobacteria bacterium]|nr:MAG: phytanoyl-CoA dioxygenase [Acidobacteriota bacterium]
MAGVDQMYSAIGLHHEGSWIAACNPSAYGHIDSGLLQDLRVAYFFDPESARKSMTDVGICLVNGVLDQERIQELRNVFPKDAHGIRNLLDLQMIRELACSESVKGLAQSVLGNDCFAVRGIFFDKPSNANWKLCFHQDVTIEVQFRKDAPGFCNWRVKDQIQCVQPPTEILKRIVSVRLHLDDSRSDNGPLRIFRGSHKNGRLTQSQIDQIIESETPVECRVPVGGALMMKPFVVHGSSSALNPTHRRVIHLDYAADDLPHGLEWRHRVYSA